jgi:hypothetical protein
MDDPADSWYTLGYMNATTMSRHARSGGSGGTPYAFRIVE